MLPERSDGGRGTGRGGGQERLDSGGVVQKHTHGRHVRPCQHGAFRGHSPQQRLKTGECQRGQGGAVLLQAHGVGVEVLPCGRGGRGGLHFQPGQRGTPGSGAGIAPEQLQELRIFEDLACMFVHELACWTGAAAVRHLPVLPLISCGSRGMVSSAYGDPTVTLAAGAIAPLAALSAAHGTERGQLSEPVRAMNRQKPVRNACEAAKQGLRCVRGIYGSGVRWDRHPRTRRPGTA